MYKMQPLTATQITDCDVPRAQVDVDVDADACYSPVAAISWKTNAQPSGLKQRQLIYTSTPKDKLKQQQQQRNNAIGFCNSAKAIRKHYVYVGEGSAAAVVKGKGEEGQGPSFFDERLKAFIILFGILSIGHQIVSLTSKYVYIYTCVYTNLSSVLTIYKMHAQLVMKMYLILILKNINLKLV